MKYDPLSRYHWLPANPISDDRLDACVIIGILLSIAVAVCLTRLAAEYHERREG